MLPSTSEPELSADNEGRSNPDHVAVPQAQDAEAETVSVKTQDQDSKGDKAINDHGLTPEEAAAFDELTKQLSDCLLQKGRVVTGKKVRQLPLAPAPIDSESELKTSAEIIPQRLENSPKAESTMTNEAEARRICKPYTYHERNMVMLDSNGLSGNYWKSVSDSGNCQDGRPKRAKAGAKMINLKKTKRKLEDKLETPKASERIKLAKAAGLSIASVSSGLVIQESSTSPEQPTPAEIVPGPQMAILTLVNQLSLVTTLATALCVPESFSAGSETKYKALLTECEENENHHTNISASRSAGGTRKKSRKSTSGKNKRGKQNFAIGNITRSTGSSSGTELGKFYANFNLQSNILTPIVTATTGNDRLGLGIRLDSILYHPFYFHHGKSGICGRPLRCAVKYMSLPTNWMKFQCFPSGKEDTAENLRLMLKSSKSRQIHGKIGTHPVADEGVLLSREGFVVAFLEFGRRKEKPKLFQCGLPGDDLVRFPLLKLPDAEDGMTWLFYELPEDLLGLSSIWLLEIGVIISVADMLKELKSGAGIIEHKFKHCDQKDIKGPNYVMICQMLPSLVVYGPVAKDSIIKDPVLGQDYFNWYAGNNVGGHGLISTVRPGFLEILDCGK